MEAEVIKVSVAEPLVEAADEDVLVSEGFAAIPQDERRISADSIAAAVASFLFIAYVFLFFC